MAAQILLPPNVQLGVVPTHLGFVNSLVPDENGRFPRDKQGVLKTVAGMRALCEISRVKLTSVQIPFFPGVNPAEVAELVGAIRTLDLDITFILMVGGVNPMDPIDEDAVVAQMVPSLRAAISHGVRHVSSTSIEEWMSAKESRRQGADFDAAITQNVKVHLRVYQEAELAGSCVENWHIEFLRPGEFKTFTNLESGWAFVRAANETLGKKFFRQLVDAAHCGDSGLSMAENEALIFQIAAADELGIFHASAKTTRGCLSTDDGWVGAMLTAMARTGKLRQVFVEIFDHEDAGLELLRAIEPHFGVDTRVGRTYSEVVADGLADLACRLNNLAVRGIWKS